MGDELQLQPQEVPHLTLRKMTNTRRYGEALHITYTEGYPDLYMDPYV